MMLLFRKSVSLKKVDPGGSGDIDNPAGVIQITEAKGWQESAYLKWGSIRGCFFL